MFRRNAVTLAPLSSICFMADGASGAGDTTKAVRLNAEAKALLLQINDAGDAGFKIEDRTNAATKTLIKYGYVLFNETTASGNSVLSALSPAGKAKAETYKRAESATPRGPLPSPDDFEIETDVPVPDFTSRRSAVRQVYPFERMPVGSSFFIPAPDSFQGDDFAKAKLSTVSAQNRRAKQAWEEKPEAERGECPVWKITNDTKADKKGARVFRVA